MVQSFNHVGFQERLHVINDVETGVPGIIAIHSTAIGPAAAGCRFWHYETQTDLITDAVRLADHLAQQMIADPRKRQAA